MVAGEVHTLKAETSEYMGLLQDVYVGGRGNLSCSDADGGATGLGTRRGAGSSRRWLAML